MDGDSDPKLTTAQNFLGGDPTWTPSEIVRLASELRASEPVLAARVTRELASRLLTRKVQMDWQTVDLLWTTCKQVEAFAFARRVLARRIAGWEQIIEKHYPKQPSPLRLRQQLALCTSKDPDLSAASRHDWALKLLSPDEHGDPETQGIAGGILKRRWEWDGSRQSLERSLVHYRQGMDNDPLVDSGYLAINCAFVMDLLASLSADQVVAQTYSDEADKLRVALVSGLTPGDKWSDASLAEAHFGLGQLKEASAAMIRYMKAEPDTWELDTTLRQLVRLGHLRGFDPASVSSVLAPPLAAQPSERGPDPRLTSLLVGRVGLALSGGGFRASLYHLGVLAKLAEADVLRHVEVLSCVSGGSIVGAQYYLALRQKLKDAGESLGRKEYIEVIEDVLRRFVDGVGDNLRTRVLSNLRTSYAIVRGKSDRVYSKRVSDEIHRLFYAPFIAKDTTFDQLDIVPKDAPTHFHPGVHNWTRRNKVPVLVINAATLNTGHNWQFTVRSMGESPFLVEPAVDNAARLRRARYHSETPDRFVRLSDAVAASSCVPGVFAPMQLDELYPNQKVRLVDGGVFDNQGAASLIEQDCHVAIVSDASGQLSMESSAGSGLVAPLLRSIGILQERMRQSSFTTLLRRKEAGQLRGLAYMHLTQDLRCRPLDWTGCEDPHEKNDQLPADFIEGVTTSYGVRREIQQHLADMRTDLDVFSEIECAALMASGYAAMGQQLHALIKDVPALPVSQAPHAWFFSPVLPIVAGPDHHPGAYKTLREHLRVSSAVIGRSIKLDRRLRLVSGGGFAIVAAAVLWAVWTWRHVQLLTVGSLAFMLFVFAVRAFVGNWATLIVNPRRALTVPMRGALGALALWTFSNVMLRWIDPGYRKRGKLEKLR